MTVSFLEESTYINRTSKTTLSLYSYFSVEIIFLFLSVKNEFTVYRFSRSYPEGYVDPEGGGIHFILLLFSGGILGTQSLNACVLVCVRVHTCAWGGGGVCVCVCMC